jgi:hypothetical protein
VIEHDVEAEDFEAHVVCVILGVHCLLYFGDSGVACDDGLDEHVIDPLLQRLHVMAHLSDGLVGRTQRPLMAFVAVCISLFLPSRD